MRHYSSWSIIRGQILIATIAETDYPSSFDERWTWQISSTFVWEQKKSPRKVSSEFYISPLSNNEPSAKPWKLTFPSTLTVELHQTVISNNCFIVENFHKTTAMLALHFHCLIFLFLTSQWKELRFFFNLKNSKCSFKIQEQRSVRVQPYNTHFSHEQSQ